jgi:hypothetical protein
MNLGEINALLTISCCQMKHFGYVTKAVAKVLVIVQLVHSSWKK